MDPLIVSAGTLMVKLSSKLCSCERPSHKRGIKADPLIHCLYTKHTKLPKLLSKKSNS